MNSNFSDLLSKLNSQYVQKTHDAPGQSLQTNKIVIGKNDFDNLSKFELQTIRTIGNIWGLMNDSSGEVTMDVLSECISRLGRYKTDTEKNYLIGLFFPEKLLQKNIHQINPFPIPTYTFHQNYTFAISPNNFGNFVVQLVCPFMADTTTASTISNFYVNTDSTLSGQNIVSGQSAVIGTNWTAYPQTKVIPGWFNTSVLLFAKVSCKYYGRSDVESGYFGASYHISSNPVNTVDTATSQFDFVNKSINGCVGPLQKGMNAVYYPPDYSYLNFGLVANSVTSTSTNQTNVRLNVYGTSLPPPSLSSQSVTCIVTLVWNTIPTSTYSDLLPLDYSVEDETIDFTRTASLVPKGKLATFTDDDSNKISNLITKPKIVRDGLLNDYLDNKRNDENTTSVLDYSNDINHPLNNSNVVVPKNMIISQSSDSKNKSIAGLNYH